MKELEWFDRVAEPEDPAAETPERQRRRWKLTIGREMVQWASGDRCRYCGQWIGHWGGGVAGGPPPCPMIPLNLPLDEVRPNCLMVRRHWIGDAIRAACEKRGAA